MGSSAWEQKAQEMQQEQKAKDKADPAKPLDESASMVTTSGQRLPVAEHKLTPEQRAQFQAEMEKRRAAAAADPNGVPTMPVDRGPATNGEGDLLMPPSSAMPNPAQAVVQSVNDASVQYKGQEIDPNVAGVIYQGIADISKAQEEVRAQIKEMTPHIEKFANDEEMALNAQQGIDEEMAKHTEDAIRSRAQIAVQFDDQIKTIKKQREHLTYKHFTEMRDRMQEYDKGPSGWLKSMHGREKMNFVMGIIGTAITDAIYSRPGGVQTMFDHMVDQHMRQLEKSMGMENDQYGTNMGILDTNLAYYNEEKAKAYHRIDEELAIWQAKTSSMGIKAKYDKERSAIQLKRDQFLMNAAENRVDSSTKAAAAQMTGIAHLLSAQDMSIRLNDRKEMKQNELTVPGYGVALNAKDKERAQTSVIQGHKLMQFISDVANMAWYKKAFPKEFDDNKAQYLTQLKMAWGTLAQELKLGVLQKHDLEFVGSIMGEGNLDELITQKGRLAGAAKSILQDIQQTVQQSTGKKLDGSEPVFELINQMPPEMRDRIMSSSNRDAQGGVEVR